MALNYAQKYSSNVDEKFKISSLTAPAINNDYDFDGVNTVNVYSIPTVALTDYDTSGTNRYGNPGELSSSIQTMTLTKDRSFTFTIDRRNYSDSMMALEAGKALARQIDEVVIPEIDVYRFWVITNEAVSANNVKKGTISKTNAYESFLDGVTSLTDGKVPMMGRVAFVTPNFYKLIKLDGTFIKSGDLSQEMLLKGQVGEIDGIPVVLTPTSYLPTGVNFIITHPLATVSPVKLSEYRIHENPPGISGWLAEGRIYYDAFVLNNKTDAIYVHITE